MRRTSRPHKRQNIKKQDIILNIMEENNSLFVSMEFQNFSEYHFSEKAEIHLEAYNRQDIDHIKIGAVQSFEGKTKKKLPSFEVPARSKIKFRLKVVDTKTWHLLGLAEKLKEKKYAEALLPLETSSDIKTVFKVNWDDPDSPILVVNQELNECLTDIKPLLSEVVFREILNALLFQNVCNWDDLEDHKWIQFAKSYNPYPDELLTENSTVDEKLEWINDVIDEYSKKIKIVKKLKAKLKKD